MRVSYDESIKDSESKGDRSGCSLSQISLNKFGDDEEENYPDVSLLVRQIIEQQQEEMVDRSESEHPYTQQHYYDIYRVKCKIYNIPEEENASV